MTGQALEAMISEVFCSPDGSIIPCFYEWTWCGNGNSGKDWREWEREGKEWKEREVIERMGKIGGSGKEMERMGQRLDLVIFEVSSLNDSIIP